MEQLRRAQDEERRGGRGGNGPGGDDDGRGETGHGGPWPTGGGESLASAIYYVLLAATAVLLLVFVFTAGFERLLSAIPDDAAYYFKIAENAAAGAGETFDGINRTNGYQPLWMYLLVPAYRIGGAAGAGPEAMCRIVLAVQIMLLAAAAVLLHRLCASVFPPRAALVGGIIFLVFVFMPAVNGMESALLVTLVVVIAVLGWKKRVAAPGPFARDFFFGALTGLVVLARLDMIFLPALICALCLVRAAAGAADRRGFLLKAAAVCAGSALVVAPYVIRNIVVFGAAVPISGALKSSFPHVSNPGYALSRMGPRDRAALIVALAYSAWMLDRWWGGRRAAGGRNGCGRSAGRRSGDISEGARYFADATMVLCGAVLLHAVHTIFFMKWAVFRWHFVIYSLAAVFVVCCAVARFLRRRHGRAHAAAYWFGVAALIGLGGFVTAKRYAGTAPEDWITQSYRAALWAREHTPPNAVFAMKDAGNFGYFGRRSVISLDGVVNNMVYQDAVRDRRLARYLGERDVSYIAQHAFWNREEITSGAYEIFPASYMSRMYGTESDTLLLRKEWEVYRSEPYFDGPYRTVFVIWRIQR